MNTMFLLTRKTTTTTTTKNIEFIISDLNMHTKINVF